jgi:hypothetical protein
MKIEKLLRQFGENGNEYSPIELGDKINEIIDYLFKDEVISKEEREKNGRIILENTNGYPARCPSSGDRVYFIREGKKSWIKNLETLQKLGFDLHKVKNISNEEMNSFNHDKPIDMKEYDVTEVVEKQEDGEQYNLK